MKNMLLLCYPHSNDAPNRQHLCNRAATSGMNMVLKIRLHDVRGEMWLTRMQLCPRQDIPITGIIRNVQISLYR